MRFSRRPISPLTMPPSSDVLCSPPSSIFRSHTDDDAPFFSTLIDAAAISKRLRDSSRAHAPAVSYSSTGDARTSGRHLEYFVMMFCRDEFPPACWRGLVVRHDTLILPFRARCSARGLLSRSRRAAMLVRRLGRLGRMTVAPLVFAAALESSWLSEKSDYFIIYFLSYFSCPCETYRFIMPH